MSGIVVLGAGVSGLVAGLMLARDGHDVTLLERDPADVPDSADHAWETWSRQGVAQFNQAHFLQPRGREVLQQELPDVLEALDDAGGFRFDLLSIMPPTITDRDPREGDERYSTLTARRPVLEFVLARAGESQPGMDVRRGVTATGLLTRAYDGVPHVVGVTTDRGEALPADLVVDALGRRSPLPGWIAELDGKTVDEKAEDLGYLYYTRFFRAHAALPQFRSAPSTPVGSFSVLILPSDNDTWSLTLFTSAGDQPMKRLRDPDRWTAVVAACPLHAQWLDGEPITDVLPMGGLADRHRRLVVDGQALVHGVAMLGDAWACTNPSLGRGMTLALMHAQHLRNVVRGGLDDPRRLTEAWDATTDEHLTPWYRDTVSQDRARLEEIALARDGIALPAPDDAATAIRAALPTAMRYDADLFRAALDIRCCHATTDEVLARAGMSERILAVAGAHDAGPVPGPDREQLLTLLA